MLQIIQLITTVSILLRYYGKALAQLRNFLGRLLVAILRNMQLFHFMAQFVRESN